MERAPDLGPLSPSLQLGQRCAVLRAWAESVEKLLMNTDVSGTEKHREVWYQPCNLQKEQWQWAIFLPSDGQPCPEGGRIGKMLFSPFYRT